MYSLFFSDFFSIISNLFIHLPIDGYLVCFQFVGYYT